MSAQGYPDFQRNTQQAGPAFIAATAVVVNPAVTYGPFPVAIWPSVVARIDTKNASANVKADFSFYADQALTQLLTTVSYVAQFGAIITDGVPCVGSWMTVRVESDVANPNNKVDINVAPFSTTTVAAKTQPPNGMFDVSGASVNAADVNTYYSPYVSTGLFQVEAQLVGTSPDGFVLISARQFSGVSRPIAQVKPAVLVTGRAYGYAQFYMPGGQPRIDIFNNSATNQFLADVTIVPAS